MLAELWIATAVLTNGSIVRFVSTTRTACIEKRIELLEYQLYNQKLEGQLIKDASRPCFKEDK